MSDTGAGARLAVDIGGTFTDVVVEAGGRRAIAKVLTTPAAPEKAVVKGMRAVLAEAGLGPADIALVIHGTTLATNAIIERKGARTALVTTEGFRDVLDIADEGRFDQYDIFIEKPAPLVPRRLRLTVPERVDLNGRVLRRLDEEAVRALVPELERLGVESVAVGFLHAYANPAHERRTRELLREALPALAVTLSSEVCPEVREYERLSTAAANAYVQPLIAGYLARLRDELTSLGLAAPILLMTSGGGLTTLETAIRFPVRLVESGPAGGVILTAHVAAECGLDRVVSFDMGGTTAKICLIRDYEPETSRVFEVARSARFMKGSGLPIRIPAIEMVEIGAGGGSIARLDEMGRLAVGPDSAGADPGPACYGRGGEEATVTDADVALGRIDPESFAGGQVRIKPERAGAATERAVGRPLGLSPPLAAYAVAEIVDENMANAARVHAIERGQVIGAHTLVAFGGAAPLHACRVAEKLGIARIVVPTDAGVGSAVGFLRAPVAYEVVRSRYMRLKDFDEAAANAALDEMGAEAREVAAAGAPGAALGERRLAYMRYVGQGHEIAVALPGRPLAAGDGATLKDAFEAEYARLFARVIPDAEIEVLSWSVATGAERARPAPLADGHDPYAPEAAATRRLFDPAREDFVDVPVLARADLRPGARLQGPALIAEEATSTFVAAGFDARIAAGGYIVMERGEAMPEETRP